jgi:hypothetical protein
MAHRARPAHAEVPIVARRGQPQLNLHRCVADAFGARERRLVRVPVGAEDVDQVAREVIDRAEAVVAAHHQQAVVVGGILQALARPGRADLEVLTTA